MARSPFKTSRLLWLLLGAIVLVALLYHLRNALLPFAVGGALAYVLDPIVSSLERRIPWMSSRPDLKRLILILLTFAIAIILGIGAIIAVIPPISNEISRFVDNLPSLITQARATVESVDAEIVERLPEEAVTAIHDAAQDIGALAIPVVRFFAARTYGVITQTLSLLLGLAMAPLILFYILKDKRKIIEGMLATLSPEPRKHTQNVLGILNDVFGAYIRGQLILGLIVGVMVFIGLWLMGVPFSPVLGLVAGLTELIPVIGPWLGAIPALLVVLATAPDKFLWVALLYLVVQQLENIFLVPRVQSESLNLHPVMVLAALIVGSEVAGLWGMIMGPPFAAAGRGVLLYFLSVWRAQDDADASETVLQDDAPQPSDALQEPAVAADEAVNS